MSIWRREFSIFTREYICLSLSCVCFFHKRLRKKCNWFLIHFHLKDVLDAIWLSLRLCVYLYTLFILQGESYTTSNELLSSHSHSWRRGLIILCRFVTRFRDSERKKPLFKESMRCSWFEPQCDTALIGNMGYKVNESKANIL